jgi:hypothetical protein
VPAKKKKKKKSVRIEILSLFCPHNRCGHICQLAVIAKNELLRSSVEVSVLW